MKQLTQLPQLRVVVNTRCGRACFFCRPSGESIPTNPNLELTSEDVVKVCRSAVRLGVRAVKLTGGDPALWDPLIECVKQLKHDVGVHHVQVISRHPCIGEIAEDLANAGLNLLNISLDTLDPVLHQIITGKNDLEPLLDTIRHCAEVLPCKINTVLMRGINEGEINDIIRFCEVANIQYLKFLDVIQDLEKGSETYANRLYKLKGIQPSETFFSLSNIVTQLKSRTAEITTIHQGGLGHPMTCIRLSSGLEVVVKDHRTGACYGSVCNGCPHFKCHDALMALRLTPDVRLQFCLLREDNAIDLSPYLNQREDKLDSVMYRALRIYDTATFREGQASSKSQVGIRL